MDVWSDIDEDLNKLERDGLYRTVNELRSALSAARFERDIWWPLAFLVGTICGYGVSYVW